MVFLWVMKMVRNGLKGIGIWNGITFVGSEAKCWGSGIFAGWGRIGVVSLGSMMNG